MEKRRFIWLAILLFFSFLLIGYALLSTTEKGVTGNVITGEAIQFIEGFYFAEPLALVSEETVPLEIVDSQFAPIISLVSIVQNKDQLELEVRGENLQEVQYIVIDTREVVLETVRFNGDASTLYIPITPGFETSDHSIVIGTSAGESKPHFISADQAPFGKLTFDEGKVNQKLEQGDLRVETQKVPETIPRDTSNFAYDFEVYWSKQAAPANTQVDAVLEVKSGHDCEGVKVAFNVFESDTFFGDDPAIVQPKPTVIVDGQARGYWEVEDAGDGFGGDPEYYFTAVAQKGPTIIADRSELLTIADETEDSFEEAAPIGGCLASGATHNGVTWTFNETIGAGKCGLFSSGAPWVVGPVEIIAVSPKRSFLSYTIPVSKDSQGKELNRGQDAPFRMYDSTLNITTTHKYGDTISTYYLHGSEINPSAKHGDRTGLGYMRWLTYDPSKDIELRLPVAVGTSGAASVVSVESVASGSGRPQVSKGAILTVLPAPPTKNFELRPPYAGADKTLRFNRFDFDFSKLKSLSTKSTHYPNSLLSLIAKFEKPRTGEHIPGFGGRESASPLDANNWYSREVATEVGEALLLINSDPSGRAISKTLKEDLSMGIIQWAIDLCGIIHDNGGQPVWFSNGGHGSGRLAPIAFAAHMLNDSHPHKSWLTSCLNKGTSFTQGDGFGEYGQTFAVSQREVDITNSGAWNPDRRSGTPQRYNNSDKGTPEWGIRNDRRPDMDNKDWDANYRQCCTANSWTGQILAFHILGLTDLIKEPALFTYQDRFVARQKSDSDTWSTSLLARDMWNEHRSSYGSCGDSKTDAALGEQCDDGNQVNGDGCSAACMRESGGANSCAAQSGTVCTKKQICNPSNIILAHTSGGLCCQTAGAGCFTSSVNQSTIMHLPLDETGTPTTFTDTAGRYNAVCRAASCPIPTSQGKKNGAMVFDGKDDYIEAKTSEPGKIGLGGRMAIALWFKANGFGTNSSEPEYILGHSFGTTSYSNRIQLYTDEPTGKLKLGLGDSHTVSTNAADLETGRWYHVAIVIDVFQPDYVLYLDGVQVATGPVTGLTAMNPVFDIGNNGLTSDRTEAFDGVIDEVRTFNRVLDAQEIKSIMNQTLKVPVPKVTSVKPVVLSIASKRNITVEGSDFVVDSKGDKSKESRIGLVGGQFPSTNPLILSPDTIIDTPGKDTMIFNTLPPLDKGFVAKYNLYAINPPTVLSNPTPFEIVECVQSDIPLNCSTGLSGACSIGTRTCLANNTWGSCIPTTSVCAAFNYSLSVSPSTSSARQGEFATTTVTVQKTTATSQGIVKLKLNNNDPNITETFIPSSCVFTTTRNTCTAVLNISVGPRTSIGTKALTIAGTSGKGIIRTAPHTLTVTARKPTGTPVLNKITPNTVSNKVNTDVSFEGVNFTELAALRVGPVLLDIANTVPINDTLVRFLATTTLPAGNYPVQVVNVDGKLSNPLPFTINSNTATQGILDTDLDGIPNAKDKCPRTPSKLHIKSRSSQSGCPLPDYGGLTQSLTTNFANITDLHKVKSLRLGILNKALIKFTKDTKLTKDNSNYLRYEAVDLINNIKLEKNKVSVDSVNLPGLNVSADITFFNSTLKNPVPFVNKVHCTKCTVTSYDATSTDVDLSVPYWSEYEIREGSCGDGYCSIIESQSSCSADCGAPKKSGGSGGGGGGGGGGGSDKSSKVTTVSLDDGTSHSINVTSSTKLDVTINAKIYRIEVTKIANDLVTLRLVNISKLLNAEQSKSYFVDIDSSGSEDLELHITKNGAAYTLIMKKVLRTNTQTERETEDQGSTTQETPATTTHVANKFKPSRAGFWTIIMGVILVTLSLYFLELKRTHKPTVVSNTKISKSNRPFAQKEPPKKPIVKTTKQEVKKPTPPATVQTPAAEPQQKTVYRYKFERPANAHMTEIASPKPSQTTPVTPPTQGIQTQTDNKATPKQPTAIPKMVSEEEKNKMLDNSSEEKEEFDPYA